jgi:tetratricopeptide (TPR) repeat protein
MVLTLEAIRLPRAVAGVERDGDNVWASNAYARAFREYGIDVEQLVPAEAAEQIRARAIRVELTVTLDHWARLRKAARKPDNPGWKHILAVARAADDDDWRNQLRQALLEDKVATLHELARSEKIKDMPLQTLSLLANCTLDAQDCEIVLRQAQRKYPDDFHINFQLAWALEFQRHAELEEAIRFYTTALALRPRNMPTHCRLGLTLQERGRLDEAVAVFRRAVDLDPDYTHAVNCLAAALFERGAFAETLTLYRKQLERYPDAGWAFNNLAWFLATCADGRFRDPALAVEHAEKAVALTPGEGTFWNTLGVAHYRAGHWQDSKAALEKSMQLMRGSSEGFNTLFMAMVQWRLGKQEAARRSLRQGIAWIGQHYARSPELRRFRAEAEQLLRVTSKDAKEK